MEGINETTKKDIGKSIKRIRKSKNMTQEDLAKKVGIITNSISRIENGKNSPSTVVFIKIASALDVDLNELL